MSSAVEHVMVVILENADLSTAGSVSSGDFNHYSLLKTIETIFHLDPLAPNDQLATPIEGIWQTR